MAMEAVTGDGRGGFHWTVAVTGNCKGDAKATASVAGQVMEGTMGDSGRDRQQQ